jgi:hypothetical protein
MGLRELGLRAVSTRLDWWRTQLETAAETGDAERHRECVRQIAICERELAREVVKRMTETT